MSATEIKNLSDEQLVHGMLSRERDLVTARFAHSMNQLENTASLAVIRKDIARMKSEARAREIVAKLGKGALVSKHRGSFTAQKAGEQAGQSPEKGGFLKGIVDKLSAKE